MHCSLQTSSTVWKHVLEGLELLLIANALNTCVIMLRELAQASDTWPGLICVPLPTSEAVAVQLLHLPAHSLLANDAVPCPV